MQKRVEGLGKWIRYTSASLRSWTLHQSSHGFATKTKALGREITLATQATSVQT